MWAISWLADDHDTGYHDYPDGNGTVVVARGAIRHERLRLDGDPEGHAAKAGEAFCFDNTFIHRMRRESGAGETVNIHAYPPPLKRTASTPKPRTGAYAGSQPRQRSSSNPEARKASQATYPHDHGHRVGVRGTLERRPRTLTVRGESLRPAAFDEGQWPARRFFSRAMATARISTESA